MPSSKPLFWRAVITSPLMAIYGITPLYLLGTISFERLIVSFLGLSSGVFIFWMINLFLFRRALHRQQRYLYSYLIILTMHLIPTLLLLHMETHEFVVSRLLYTIIATLAVNTVIILMIEAEYTRRQKEYAEEENSQLKIKQLEAQKKALHQQLQPHFLFNALSTLKSLIREDTDEAEDYVLRLSDFLRYTTQTAHREVVSVEEELSFAGDYLMLQQKRFGQALRCQTDIPADWYRYRIPVFAIQTLIENAIKHNKFSEKNPLYIRILTDPPYIRVENNRSPKPLVQPSGTGLQNLNERYLLSLKTPVRVIQTDELFCVLLNVMQHENPHH